MKTMHARYSEPVKIYWKQTLSCPAAEEQNNTQLPHWSMEHSLHSSCTLLHEHSWCSATKVKSVISIMFNFFSQMPCYLRYWIVLPFKRSSICWALKPRLYRIIYHLVFNAKSTFLIGTKTTFIQSGFHQISTPFYKSTVNVISTFLFHFTS